tara:strand:- start:2169 stop:2582 length:414 start_codon:yes stop_codon:yes gene_type:complete
MGLDMYLTGDRYAPSHGDNERDIVDGYEVESVRLKLGYWRKHCALHNFIVDRFADGEDNCLPIELSAEKLREIAKAVEDGKLVDPDAFSADGMDHYKSVYEYHREPEQVRETVDMLRNAAKWVDGGDWNTVEYQASW